MLIHFHSVLVNKPVEVKEAKVKPLAVFLDEASHDDT